MTKAIWQLHISRLPKSGSIYLSIQTCHLDIFIRIRENSRRGKTKAQTIKPESQYSPPTTQNTGNFLGTMSMHKFSKVRCDGDFALQFWVFVSCWHVMTRTKVKKVRAQSSKEITESWKSIWKSFNRPF